MGILSYLGFIVLALLGVGKLKDLLAGHISFVSFVITEVIVIFLMLRIYNFIIE